MDLQNTLPHKRNTAVNVDGTEYKIDGQGICRGVSDEHAKTMLQNRDAWRQLIVRTPIAEGKSAADRPRLQPILSTGEVLPPPVEEEALPESEEPSAPVEAVEEKPKKKRK
jgi:hypothetical protein